jgi:hypothetical protein
VSDTERPSQGSDATKAAPAIAGDERRALALARAPIDAAKLFSACDSFDDAAHVAAGILQQYTGVRRWYALRNRYSGWAAVDMRDRSELAAEDALLFADAMLIALSDSSGLFLVARLGDFEPASEQVADCAGEAYLVGAPLLERGRVEGFICGLAPTVPFSAIRSHRALIRASIRMLNTVLELERTVRGGN